MDQTIGEVHIKKMVWQYREALVSLGVTEAGL
jgi:hypothetical protein